MKVNRLGFVIVAFAAVLGFYSCSKKPIDMPQSDTQSVIGFSNIVTKAGLSDIQNGGFGVWSFLTNDSVTDYPLMENTEVTYDSTAESWEYSPLRYWVDKSVFTFVAVYPYDENSANYTSDTNNSSVNVNIAETPAQEDYLIATNVTDTSVEGYSETVDLQFKHIFTSVGLNIWRDHGKHTNDQMRVRQVTLSNIRKAGTYSSSTDLWTYSDEKLTLEKIYENVSDEDNIGGAQVNGDGTLEKGDSPAVPFSDIMLLPQTIDDSNTVSLRIIYELKRNNAADWEVAELETILPNATWMPNKCYTYNVVLSSVTDITVYYIQTKVDPWGTPQVGGTVIIK